MCFYSSIIFTHHFLSGSGISSTRKTWTYWIETSEGTWRWFMDCSITLMTRSWERAVIIQLGENSVEIVSRCINASWEGKKDEVTFFSVVSSDKTKGNVYKLKHRKFHLNILFFFLLWGCSNFGTGQWSGWEGFIPWDIQHSVGHGAV